MCSKKNQRSGVYRAAGFRSFSSVSLGSYNRTMKASCGPSLGCHITPVSVNQTLLTPLHVDMDSTGLAESDRKDERDQIRGLNTDFAYLIGEVIREEQTNKRLETTWKLLQEKTTTASSQLQPNMEVYSSSLQKKLVMVTDHRSWLEQERISIDKSVNDYKKKYEDEVIKRKLAEKVFLELKTKADAAYQAKVKLEDEVNSVLEEIKILRTLYDMELCELKESVKESVKGLSVVVEMDNSRGLNMDQVLFEAKAQYEEIAARSRKEVECWYKVKFNQMNITTHQYNTELREAEGEMAEIQYQISRKEKEILYVQEQRVRVDVQISEAEKSGADTVKDAQDHLEKLKEVLREDKIKMADQVRRYHALMNVKLALDIEICTYGSLLEGEEKRIGHQSVISVQSNNGLHYEPPCTHRGPRSPVPCCEEQLYFWYPSCDRPTMQTPESPSKDPVPNQTTKTPGATVLINQTIETPGATVLINQTIETQEATVLIDHQTIETRYY